MLDNNNKKKERPTLKNCKKEHVHPILDSAAMAVIKKMPPWQLGKKDGKKVAVLYSVPISFTLPK